MTRTRNTRNPHLMRLFCVPILHSSSTERRPAISEIEFPKKHNPGQVVNKTAVGSRPPAVGRSGLLASDHGFTAAMGQVRDTSLITFDTRVGLWRGFLRLSRRQRPRGNGSVAEFGRQPSREPPVVLCANPLPVMTRMETHQSGPPPIWKRPAPAS